MHDTCFLPASPIYTSPIYAPRENGPEVALRSFVCYQFYPVIRVSQDHVIVNSTLSLTNAFVFIQHFVLQQLPVVCFIYAS